MIKPSLCPSCGAFVRLGWTENCGSCGAELVFVETQQPAPRNTVGFSRGRLAVEWLSRPRQTIGTVVITVGLSCLAIGAFAMSNSTPPAAISPPSPHSPSARPDPYVPNDFKTPSLDENIEELPPLE